MSRELDPPVLVTPEAGARPGCGATTVNPQPYFDRLTEAVQRLGATRSIQRQLIALADEVPTITNEQLANRLAALARPTTGTAMTPLVRFPLDQVIWFDAMATVDTTVWCCRICERDGRARTTPEAIRDALAHLGCDHGGEADPQTPAGPG